MKTKSLITVFLVFFSFSVFAQFDRWFEDKTLRIDYQHSGTDSTEFYAVDELREEPYWGGSRTNLIDTFQYGKYYFEVFDLESDSLIYSRGYSSLFGEWQTTSEVKTRRKSFSESVVFPYPKNDVRVDFFSRNDESGELEKKFEYEVDPDNYFINPQLRMQHPVYDAYIAGDPSHCVDIIILPDGYTEEEMEQFKLDCNNFANHLFSFSPYDQNKDKFNIRGVLVPSKQSGGDKPAEGIWKHTIVSSSYSTFDSERYCMTLDNKAVRDLAANAPYDQIYILLNDPKYGGGGIYNFYCLSVNSNQQAAKIFIHEFGHGFAGLGDEYYNSEVAYDGFYNEEVEPWEPNLTTLVDFESKWKGMLADTVPVPTPNSPEYQNVIGVFEGGGYENEGVYRPAYNCLMNTFFLDNFCEVCKYNIQKMIDFYTD
ncbi:MAG: IgA Peptidase M64 [Bacteroidales bacterium]|nr:IgA Peptidase M64 [Bacteroidales bacterium]